MANDQAWSVAECTRILLRRKGVLLSITILGVLVTALISSMQPRLYQSRASLEIQTFNDNFLNLRDIFPTTAATFDVLMSVETQAELLQQDLLIEQVARKFRLNERPEYQPPSTFLDKLRQDIRVLPVRNSRMLHIVCDSRDARLAAGLANTLAATFIEQSIEARQQAARHTYESLLLQLQQIKPRSGQVARANLPLYDATLRRIRDAQMASGLRQSNIRFASAAQPAPRPYTPNFPLNLAIGAVGGFAIAVGYVMLHAETASPLHAPGEAGTFLSLPELGAIPGHDGWKPSTFHFFRSAGEKVRVDRAVLELRTSQLSESFRSTVTSILSNTRDRKRPKSLVFTSSQPMEGKTTVVSNLGFALAEIGRQVLVIDGDMRRPQLHKTFDQTNTWGLSDVLREWNSIEELPLKALVKKTMTPNLYLMSGGTSTDNILGLLHSGRMSKLLARFREEFDCVLVDAPPCLEFADATNMGRCADGLVLVVRASCTDRKMAQSAVHRLECDGAQVTGVILNGWDSSRSRPYNYPSLRLGPQRIG